MSETKNPVTHVLTIAIDLSHPAFADRAFGAQLNILQALQACEEAVLVGSETSLLQHQDGTPLGIYAIRRDESGEIKKGIRESAEALLRLKQTAGADTTKPA